jgi:virginiamycin A acetyltransferase
MSFSQRLQGALKSYLRSFLDLRAIRNLRHFPAEQFDEIDSSAVVLRAHLRGRIRVGAKTRLENVSMAGDIEIGDNVRLIDVSVRGRVSVGRYTSIVGPGTDVLSVLEPIRIGRFCSIARNVAIQEHNHRSERCSSYLMMHNFFGERIENDLVSKGPIHIGNDVWIGTQSVVVSGAEIGDGAVIGANSTVTGKIPPYAIAVGSPARPIGYRFDEATIARLLELQWWNFDDETLRRNRDLFEGSLTPEKLEQVRHV